MSKDAAIAEIVKNLHNLDLEDNQQILQFIKHKKDQNKKEKTPSKPKHTDRDRTQINKGDKVFLLTPGVYNKRGEKGSVHTLPKMVGKYITFKCNRVAKGKDYDTYLQKLGRSVRKVPDDYDK